jgi:superfamily II DNA or RNA helicase
MSKICTIVLNDEVNVKLKGLESDVKTRKKIVQALEYFLPYAYHVPMFKLGRWDGKKSFATLGGTTYLNLLDRVFPILEENNYDIEIEDNRKRWDIDFPSIESVSEALAQKTWPEGHPLVGQPIVLRDYQLEAIKSFIENHQSIESLTTGAGKTIISAALSMICEPLGRTIVIVPSKTLVTQTEDDYKNLGLDVGVFYGDRKELNHTHTICTWQSLYSLDKQTANKKHGLLSDKDIHEFLDGVVMVLTDECHTVKASSLTTLLTGPFKNVPIRWGFTGTIPKEEYNFLNLLLCIGPVVKTITASELQEKGVLANLDISIIQTQEQIKFADYHSEYSFLVTNEKRLKWLSSFIEDISETGNTLVLIDRIETGEKLLDLIEKDCMFVHGGVTNKKRREHFKQMNENDNEIVIASYGTSSTGLNVNRIFNLILVEPGKSFVRVIQSIGRSIRMAADKDFANIYDITAATKYSKKHSTERKKYYKEAKYPSRTIKVEY